MDLTVKITFDAIGFSYFPPDNAYVLDLESYCYSVDVAIDKYGILYGVELMSTSLDDATDSYIVIHIKAENSTVKDFIDSYFAHSRINNRHWVDLTNHYNSLIRKDTLDSILNSL